MLRRNLKKEKQRQIKLFLLSEHNHYQGKLKYSKPEENNMEELIDQTNEFSQFQPC